MLSVKGCENISRLDLAKLQADMMRRTIKRLTDQGMSVDQAEALASEALKSPPRHPIPTID